jgi:hypothetical protein
MTAYNPFVNIDLRLPSAYFDEVRSYCQTRPEGGKKPDASQSPFPRYVDFWFLAVCLGAAQSARVPDEPAGGWRGFITGAEGLGSDGWRVDVLELLAIAARDDGAVVGDSRMVVDIANRYAAAGVPLVLDMLRSGQSDPLDNVLDRLRDRMGGGRPDAQEATES